MSAPAAATGAGAPTLSTLSPFLTAIVAALGAWKLFEPKFARIRAIKTEMGSLEPTFWWLYVLPQRVMSLILWGIALFLFLTFLFSFQSSWFAPMSFVRRLVHPDNVIWVIFLSGIVAAVIYWNVATRLLLQATHWLSLMLPVRGLRGRFGPKGSSPGWHQARAVCEGPDKGSPLLIDYRELDKVGALVLARLAGRADSRNYAELPTGLDRSVKANIGLFACILEAEHNANGWPLPKWSKVYEAFAAMQAGNRMFSPEKLMAFTDGDKFFEALRNGLDRELGRRKQPKPPNSALAAEPAFAEAWELLVRRWRGDVLAMVSSIPDIRGARLFLLDRRLRKFPRLAGDGMRAQFIKLLFRWDALPGMIRRSFGQPFARVLAWLLLEERALRVLPEVKEVTFFGTGEVAIARFAARRVISNVAAAVRAGGTREARAVQRKLGTELKMLEEEADYVFWNWAYQRSKHAGKGGWETEDWKFEDGRVSRAG